MLISKKLQSDTGYKIDFKEYVGENPVCIIPFFHGLGEVGDGIDAVEVNEIPKLFKLGIEKPCVCLAFYKPSGSLWYVREIVAALEVIDDYKKKYNLPVITTGLSLGGIAQITMVQEAHKLFGPGYFAAVGIVCGKASVSDYTPFMGIPIRWWHGTNDGTLPISNARAFCSKLKSLGGDVSLVEFSGVGHNAWTRAYNDEPGNFWDWIKPFCQQGEQQTQPIPATLEYSNGELLAVIDGKKYKVNVTLTPI